MNQTVILLALLLLSSITGFCTTWTVNNSGNAFNPATITITEGDSVKFVLNNSHDAREVSQTTWNANVNTALSGGFQTPFGGGTVLPAKLGVGTHWYVCTPHAFIGMKGRIIVQSCTPPAQPGTISGSANVCPGSSNTYSITAVTGAASYTWTLPGGWTGNSTSNSITATASSTSGNIMVVATNACGSSLAQTLAITVNTVLPQPGSISGNANICSGSSNTYSITAIAGATSYTWTLPAGWTGNSATNSITVNADTTSGNITLTANNSCGSSTAQTFSVLVSHTLPAQPGNISGNTAVCNSSSNVYSIDSVSNATSYTWILPNNWTGSSTTNSITALASPPGGNISVTANNACGSSVAQTLSVTVGGGSAPAQPGAISGNATVCPGSSNTYGIAAVPNTTSYTWVLPGGWTGSSTANSITSTASKTSGNIIVSANNSCGSSAAQVLSVIVTLIDTSVSISGATLTANATTGSYQWLDCNNQALPIPGEINQTYGAGANGSYAVIVTENGCIDTSACQEVLLTGIFNNCSGATTNISIYPNPSGGKFKLEIGSSLFAKSYHWEIYNGQGMKIFAASPFSINQ